MVRRVYYARTTEKRFETCGRHVMDYSQRIMRDPAACGGSPIIKGTRVTVRTILASLAEGASIGQILEDFPSLTEDDVRAVIAFAAV